MRINKIRLFNWCQHEDLTIDLSPGMNGVFGPNGSGKSNLVDGAVYGLTGESRTDGVLAENIRHGTKKGRHSGVAIELEHSGHLFEIERRLQGTPSKILRYGGEEFTKDKAISQKIQEILGVSEDILLRYVFVEQWKIFEFLSFTEAVRSKFLSYLFGTEKTEKIWDKLRKAADRLMVDDPTTGYQLEVIQEMHTQTSNSLMAVRSALGQFPETDDTAELDSIIALWQQKQQDGERFFRLTEQSVDMETQISSVLTKMQALGAQINTLRTTVNEGNKDKPILEAELLRLTAVKANNLARERLHKQINRLTDDLEKLQACEPKAPGLDLNSLEHLRDCFRTQQMSYQRTLNFATLQVGECSHCGSIIPIEKVKEHQEDLERLKTSLEKLRADILVLTNYDSNLKTWSNKVAQLHSQIKLGCEQLDALPPSEEIPEGAEEDIKLILSQLQLDERKLFTLQASHEASTVNYRNMLQLKEKTQSEKDELSVRLNGNSVTLEKWQDAVEKRNKQAEIRAERTKLLVEEGGLRTRLGELEMQKTEALKAKEAHKKAAQVSGFLERVRDVFHKTRLPRRVAEAGLADMEEGINDLLDRFDSSFRISVQPNLGFKAKFTDGREVRAERLSGGQKAVFALAFRMVVNSKYAKDLGLLVLDEPTAGVDEQNLNCLETALDRLRQMSKSSGLQVILITHEKLLSNLFDKSHYLPALK